MGGGDSTPFVRGVPRVVGPATGLPPCPNCGCEILYDIEVNVEYPLFDGKKGIGQYVGCPACPFATPMLMVAGRSSGKGVQA